MKWSLVKKYLLFLWKVWLQVATSSFTSFITCLIASSHSLSPLPHLHLLMPWDYL